MAIRPATCRGWRSTISASDGGGGAAGHRLARHLLGRLHLTPPDETRLALLLLDHLAAALLGACSATGRAVGAQVADQARPGPAVLLAAGRGVAPAAAALGNAAAAQIGELDDTHDESLTHPGAVVIPVALALAAARPVSGTGLLTAIAAGYEAVARIGMAGQADVAARNGFHPTGLFGGFGAAAAAARLEGLEAKQLLSAWGLVLSGSGGSMQFSAEPAGGAVKPLHGAWAARSGMEAVALVRSGLDGPAGAIEGRYGACRLFSGAATLRRLTWPQGLQIHRTTIKPWPSCRPCHAPIEALLACLSGDEGREIDRILVAGPAKLAQHAARRPTTMMAAQYSLPYSLAAALRHGPQALSAFHRDALGDPATLALADRVLISVDSLCERRFPRRMGALVTIDFADGGRRTARCDDSAGSPGAPLSADEVQHKAALLLSEAGLVRAVRDRLIEMVMTLPAAADVAPLLALLAQQARSLARRPAWPG